MGSSQLTATTIKITAMKMKIIAMKIKTATTVLSKTTTTIIKKLHSRGRLYKKERSLITTDSQMVTPIS